MGHSDPCLRPLQSLIYVGPLQKIAGPGFRTKFLNFRWACKSMDHQKESCDNDNPLQIRNLEISIHQCSKDCHLFQLQSPTSIIFLMSNLVPSLYRQVSCVYYFAVALLTCLLPKDIACKGQALSALLTLKPKTHLSSATQRSKSVSNSHSSSVLLPLQAAANFYRQKGTTVIKIVFLRITSVWPKKLNRIA